MSKKQINLLQAWNKIPSSPGNRNSFGGNPSTSAQVLPSTNVSSPNVFQSPVYSRKADELADPEFDYEAGKTWIYPTNYPIRDYQFSIVKEALFKNTLVILPTGLGKTFIAAVVMFNIYRWFPNGKVVFMAPTKPLVAQQIDACFNITGIPQDDTTQMTGTNSPELRKRMWQRKRVFFLTPQVLVNDLVRNICPASTIKCLVVDEAHKALGNHAYCQVIKELCAYSSQFRVLALTATPGSETQAVKQVLSNLLISHVEMRSEDSEDVQRYTHVRDIEKIVVPLGERLTSLKSRFLDVINVYLKRLTLRKVINAKNPTSLSKFQVLKMREAFSQNPPGNIDRFTYGLAMADFSLLISLYHAYELLLLHGATSFYNFLMGILSGDKSIPHAKNELMKNFEFGEIMEYVKTNYIPESSNETEIQNERREILPAHPKLEKLLEVVLKHFQRTNAESIPDTRVMIFTQYRDSVQEIVNLLNQYQPSIKAMSFVGQSSKTATSAGISQKQQLKVIQEFRSGGYNTLVSTCVGEEGLDIGEVDLIVCYDCPKSPIRLVQRMGRTGRLRKGRIIILIAEGKEEQMLNTCEYRKKTVHRAITKGFGFAQFYQNSPSLLPPGVKPYCVKTVLTIQKKKEEPKQKVISKSPFLSDEEMAEFNKFVKVPQNEAPLLPKPEFIILKNQQENASESVSTHPVKTQLSLQEWTLWQTTPQRTDMIPHSSKSLLLVKTLENIHFPELLSSKWSSVAPDFDSFLDRSLNHSKANNHSKSFSRQTKITECLSSPKPVVEDVIVVPSSPDIEILDDIPDVEPQHSSEKSTLIERLFNLKSISKSVAVNRCHIIKPPPVTELLNIEDFSIVDIKLITRNETRSSSIFRILNKKIKAKIKKKTIEHKRNLSHKSGQFFTPTKAPCSPPNGVGKKVFKASIDISYSTDMKSGTVANEQNEFEGLQFDLDFDVPDAFENNENFDEELDLKNINNVCSKIENKLSGEGKEIDSLNFDVDFDGNGSVLEYEDIQKPTFQCSSFKAAKETNKNNELLEPSKIFSDAALAKDPQFNTLNFDIDFVEEEFLQSDNDEVVNISDASSNEDKNNGLLNATKVLPNIEKKQSYDDSKELMNCYDIKVKSSSVLPAIPKEKPYSVLKDVKNISHVLTEEKNADINKNLHLKKTSDEKNFESGVKGIQVLNSITNMFTKESSNDNSVLLNSKSKDNAVNSCISSDHTRSKINKLQQIDDEFSDFEETSHSKSKPFEKTSPTILYDVNNIEESIDHPNRKASMNEENCKVLNESKSMSKNIDGFSVGLRNKNTSLQCQAKQNIEAVTEEISNDCNFSFDVSFFNNEMKPEYHAMPSNTNITTEPTEIYALSKLNATKNIDEFDEDANMILEQLFTSQKNVSSDLNSFSSPLTVKRCLSETGKEKESEQKRKNCKVIEKKCPQPSIFKERKSSDSISFKIPSPKSHFNTDRVTEDIKVNVNTNKNTGTPHKKLNKTVSLAELAEDPSQYTLTQLLYLIDNTETIETNLEESHTKSPKCLQDNSGVYNASSEDEVCPTPPKEIAKPKSEFIYSKKAKVRKSLDFKKFEKFDYSHMKRQDSSFSSSTVALGSKLLSTPADSFRHQKTDGQSISHKDSSGEAFKNFTRCNSPKVTLLNHEKENDNQIEDIEASPKITFDISFTFPCTQENFESPEKDVMNNAIIVESSSSEEQIIKKQNDDAFSTSKSNSNKRNYSPHEMPLQNKISNNSCNIAEPDIHLLEMMTEDSESLLPSMPINAKTSDSAKTLEEYKVFSDSSNTSKFSNFASVDVHHSSTESDKTKSEVASKLVSNQAVFSNSSKNFQKSKENSNLKSFSTKNPKYNIKSKCFEENKMKSIEDLDFEIKFKNAKRILEEKEKNCSIINLQNAPISKELPDTKLSEDFIDDKICFDVSFDDVTCNLLVPDNNPVSESKKSVNVKIPDSSDEHAEEAEPKTEYKKVMKKSIFEKNDKSSNKTLCSEQSNCKLNNANGDLVLKFDLDVDKSLLECEMSFHPESDKNSKHAASVLINDNSSEEFDFLNPNQTLKMVKPKDLNSKVADNKEIKISEAGCSNQKHSDRANTSVRDKLKNKMSSKLSRKSKMNGGAVLKNNSAIEDEDDDFQFVQKIQKKANSSSSKRIKKKKFSSRNEFLFSQADVSGSDNSAYESSDEDDHLEESFIDDESPLDYTEQHAFYLKSLKNNVGLPQKFKLKAIENSTLFAEPEVDNSKYEFDSFCVNDEEVVFVSSDEDLEYKAKAKKKSKKSKSTKRKLKRIITHDSSASSEHETTPKLRKLTEKASDERTVLNNAHDESPIVVRKQKNKVKVVSSDEDEFMFIKPSVVELQNGIKNSATNLHGAYTSESKKTVNDCVNLDKFDLDLEMDDDIQFLSEIESDGNAFVKQKSVESKVLNNTDMFHPNEIQSTSKHVNTILDSDKCIESSTADCPMDVVEFDIGWNEICPSTSDNNVNPSTSSSNKKLPSSISVNSDKSDMSSVILVDSRELASGKPVISSLRNKFKINPTVMQLPSADYVISNRIAIERILDSEFNQCNMPPRIVEKIREMSGIYEKLFVIIEKDGRKNRLSFNRNISKYLQFIVHLHCNPSFKVLFSKSADHSSEMIANLVQQERKRGFHIDVPVTLNDKNRNMFNFYSSFPKMSPTCALNLMYYFPTVDMLFKSSVEDIKKKGCISSHKANRLYKYLRNELTFHEKL